MTLLVRVPELPDRAPRFTVPPPGRLATKLLPLATHVAALLPAVELLNQVCAAVDSQVPVNPLSLPDSSTVWPPTVEIVPEPVRLPLKITLPLPLWVQPIVAVVPPGTVMGPE